MPQLEVSKGGKKLNSDTNIYLGAELTAAARRCCGSFGDGVLKPVGVAQMLRSNSLRLIQEPRGSFPHHVQGSANACGLLWL